MRSASTSASERSSRSGAASMACSPASHRRRARAIFSGRNPPSSSRAPSTYSRTRQAKARWAAR
ncbi:MAG TPA: hypothetical protein VM683_10620, partial [Anaeromyxobacteraceae bacterium]|nr:hypothetical protein [Anaeromyxobacteraceae bacterium]